VPRIIFSGTDGSEQLVDVQLGHGHGGRHHCWRRRHPRQMRRQRHLFDMSCVGGSGSGRVGKLPPVSENEGNLLDRTASPSRPSCQLPAEKDIDGLVVHLLQSARSDVVTMTGGARRLLLRSACR
jgi:hypothetical protein